MNFSHEVVLVRKLTKFKIKLIQKSYVVEYKIPCVSSKNLSELKNPVPLHIFYITELKTEKWIYNHEKNPAEKFMRK